jgi:hypothetical protein
VVERAKTVRALDRAATAIGVVDTYKRQFVVKQQTSPVDNEHVALLGYVFDFMVHSPISDAGH